MEIIMKPSKAVRSLGKVKLPEGRYHPSVYNFTVEEDGIILLHNLFTKGMLALTGAEQAALFREVSHEALEKNPALRYLAENRYLVHEGVNEQEDYLSLNRFLFDLDREPYIKAYTILTTTACNARCFYCYEQGFVPEHMSLQTAADLAAYMMEHAGGRKLSLHWFGGEPLCNTPVIDHISRLLKDYEPGFVAEIITNGYAFTPELCRRAVEQWNVNQVQVAMDGMEEEHNRRKRFLAVGDESPFRRVVENIRHLLLNGVDVTVRLNFDPENYESIRELIQFLCREFSQKQNLHFYIARIFHECGAWKSGRTAEEAREMLAQYRQLRDSIPPEFQPPGLLTNVHSYRTCIANDVHQRIVGPNGCFTPCYAISASRGYGSIYEGITDRETYERWTSKSNLQPDCDGCPMLPRCTPFRRLCPAGEADCLEKNRSGLALALPKRYKHYLEEKAAKAASQGCK